MVVLHHHFTEKECFSNVYVILSCYQIKRLLNLGITGSTAIWYLLRHQRKCAEIKITIEPNSLLHVNSKI